MNSRTATGSRAIPEYVKRNVEYYLNREAAGDSEASQKIREISDRWGF
ncbi:hypothetical protein [Methanothrix soehngenii]